MCSINSGFPLNGQSAVPVVLVELMITLNKAINIVKGVSISRRQKTNTELTASIKSLINVFQASQLFLVLSQYPVHNIISYWSLSSIYCSLVRMR